ncbi:hypothetical protein KW787_01815 [Candidatus Pacearchaeota archaeon]|nr:hypothetical protein [Candidatus Pacearchaeota archaeon]
MQGKTWILIVGLIIIVGALSIRPLSQRIHENNNAITNITGQTNINETQGFMQCAAGRYFICSETSSPLLHNKTDRPPTVCGCAPEKCPSSARFLIVGPARDSAGRITEEKWPDGSLKGNFVCESSEPP